VQVLPLTYTLSVRRFNKLAVRQCIISLRLQEYLFTCFPSLLSSNFQFPFVYYHVYLHIYCYTTRVLMIYEWHLDHKEAKSRVGKLVIYWYSFNLCVCVDPFVFYISCFLSFNYFFNFIAFMSLSNAYHNL
jgi:hypothetical protein